jgi:hypothetical protein
MLASVLKSMPITRSGKSDEEIGGSKAVPHDERGMEHSVGSGSQAPSEQ